MNRDDVVKGLNRLIELDRGTSEAYEKAIEKLHKEQDTASADQFSSFREDHNRHVREVGSLVTRYGGQPSTGKGISGTLAKGMTVVASLTGKESLIKAMRENEEQTNEHYEKAVNQGYPEDVLPTLQRNLEDERRHLAWIRQQLGETTT